MGSNIFSESLQKGNVVNKISSPNFSSSAIRDPFERSSAFSTKAKTFCFFGFVIVVITISIS